MSVPRRSEEQYAARQAAAKRAPAGKARPTRADTPAPAPGHLKYMNRPTGGYASVKEAKRAQELKLLRDAGQIRNLREQVEFVLIPKQYDDAGKMIERECKYVLDFAYDAMVVVPVDGSGPLPDRSDNGAYCRRVYEDVKGIRTKDYILKRKMMLHFHGIRITEV